MARQRRGGDVKPNPVTPEEALRIFLGTKSTVTYFASPVVVDNEAQKVFTDEAAAR
jgi:hypothetical protein